MPTGPAPRRPVQPLLAEFFDLHLNVGDTIRLSVDRVQRDTEFSFDDRRADDCHIPCSDGITVQFYSKLPDHFFGRLRFCGGLQRRSGFGKLVVSFAVWFIFAVFGLFGLAGFSAFFRPVDLPRFFL